MPLGPPPLPHNDNDGNDGGGGGGDVANTQNTQAGERASLLPPPAGPLLLGPYAGGGSGSGSGSGAYTGSTSQYSSLGAASPVSDGAASPVPGPLLLRKPRKLQNATALHINLLTALWGPACFAMPW